MTKCVKSFDIQHAHCGIKLRLKDNHFFVRFMLVDIYNCIFKLGIRMAVKYLYNFHNILATNSKYHIYNIKYVLCPFQDNSTQG